MLVASFGDGLCEAVIVAPALKRAAECGVGSRGVTRRCDGFGHALRFRSAGVALHSGGGFEGQVMKRRDWLQAAGAATMAAGLAGCGPRGDVAPVGSDADDSPRHWRMATAWAADFPGLAAAATALAERITRTSRGRLTVTAHAAGELVAPFEVFDAVGRGTVEMGHSASNFWVGKSRAAPFFSAVPFGMDAQALNAWLHFGGGLALWRELYADFNLVPFAAGNTGMQMAGWFRREIRSLADLAGMKMRMPGLGGEVLARLGVTTVNLPGSELIAALESGDLDAAEWLGPFNDLEFGLHRAAKHCYYPGWQEPGWTLECLVHKPSFDGLPEDLRDLVDTCCRATHDAVLAEYEARNIEAIAVLRDEHDIRFRPLPADVMSALRKASRDVLDSIAATNPLCKRVHDSAQAFGVRAGEWRAMAGRG